MRSQLIHGASSSALILIGPPASGKSTLRRAFQLEGYIAISAGDILREESARDTDLGRKIRPAFESGKLIDDHTIIEIVEARVRPNVAANYVFDGFPRTVPQAEALDRILKRRYFESNHIHIVQIETSDEQLAWNRDVRQHNMQLNGEVLRQDDEPEAFARRVEAYRREIVELAAYYGDRMNIVEGYREERLQQVSKITGVAFQPDTTAFLSSQLRRFEK